MKNNLSEPALASSRRDEHNNDEVGERSEQDSNSSREIQVNIQLSTTNDTRSSEGLGNNNKSSVSTNPLLFGDENSTQHNFAVPPPRIQPNRPPPVFAAFPAPNSQQRAGGTKTVGSTAGTKVAKSIMGAGNVCGSGVDKTVQPVGSIKAPTSSRSSLMPPPSSGGLAPPPSGNLKLPVGTNQGAASQLSTAKQGSLRVKVALKPRRSLMDWVR